MPQAWLGAFLAICGHFRRFPLGERCSCAPFGPLIPCVPDLFVVKYVVVIESRCSGWGAVVKEILRPIPHEPFAYG